MFPRKRTSDEISNSFAWTIAMLVNQGTYEECQGKSDEFVEGFNRAIEMFRAELSRLGD